MFATARLSPEDAMESPARSDPLDLMALAD
jgi:hypothetical protein